MASRRRSIRRVKHNRRRRARRNPLFPSTGAIMVTNPRGRRRRARKNRMSRAGSREKKAWYRGHKITKGDKAGAKKRRTAWKQYAKAGFRKFAKTPKASVKTNRGRRRVRRNGGAVFAMNRRRRNGLAVQNRRRHNRRRGLVRRNPAMAIPGMDTVTGLVDRIPLFGKDIAAVLPVAILALGGAFVNAKFVAPQVTKYVPAKLAPFTGTLTGASVAAVAKLAGRFAPGEVSAVLDLVAGASMLAGVLSDVLSFAKSKGLPVLGDAGGLAMSGVALAGYGDGGAYEIAGFGDAGALQYADAEMADAYSSGSDLDGVEGNAALSGLHGWFGTFGAPPKRAAGPHRAHSRHAGKAGHRWGWLIKLVGFENFQKIVALEPEKRVAVIHQLRQQALESVPRLLSQDTGLPAAVALEAQAQNLGGYGALVFAGG